MLSSPRIHACALTVENAGGRLGVLWPSMHLALLLHSSSAVHPQVLGACDSAQQLHYDGHHLSTWHYYRDIPENMSDML